MKNFTKFLSFAILGLVLSTSSFSQGVSGNATATATIVAPITISNVRNLVFGNIAVGAAVGTCTVTNAGVKTFGGTCSGPTAGATSAEFTIGGTAGASYYITIPASVSLTGPGAAMTLDTWDNSLGVGPGYNIPVGGSATLDLGGTLHVNASQVAGAYSGTITVTVGYN